MAKIFIKIFAILFLMMFVLKAIFAISTGFAMLVILAALISIVTLVDRKCKTMLGKLW